MYYYMFKKQRSLMFLFYNTIKNEGELRCSNTNWKKIFSLARE